jgi:DNA-3-methyladenine glycosylase II
MDLTGLNSPISLTAHSIAEGCDFLAARDPALARIYKNLGAPPLWEREPGFPTLVYIILEQQVSLASAKAAFVKLQAASGVITPEIFLRFDDAELKQIGFSRQKASYCRGLAHSILNGQTDLGQIANLEDESARAALLRIKGVGPWTANIYLLMALLRPDTWPAGDLALEVAWQRLTRLESRPTKEQLAEVAARWSPWRAVAARLLWRYYLDGFPEL